MSYTNPAAGGTAGLYFAGLLQKLGIADAVNKRKRCCRAADAMPPRKCAKGEAELGITFPSEINPVKGAKVGGMLPASLQNYVTYAATIPATSKNAEAARAYLAALTAGISAREHLDCCRL